MRGFGRWGFILGNVLIAFGAPVFVTSLVATVAAGRSGTAAGDGDVVAIVAGAAFVIAGLVVTVVAGRNRQLTQPEPGRTPAHLVLPVEPKPIRPIEPLPLTLNTLDDYYGRSDQDLGLHLDLDDEPLFPPKPTGHASVPRPRNARVYNGDRFCEPHLTATRSIGSRRRPPAG
ncbi:hypothetical protein GCM10009557_90250 [Virgisporangium ochraceum]|uniref:Uncharacterized protein n=1 Tax=Virgisporangium ochraceum TaxID=65505 RepID=A0A8J4EB40_9ACTN|nr:hypothetical protein [Virgisporangium ochraceum]GIJ68980.1 hypothetical protein Voc01_038970 [Virgisporangium ochraceum]